jgi:hypothetical protein
MAHGTSRPFGFHQNPGGRVQMPPHCLGHIDLGSAGARGNNINLVANLVLNSFNVQSTGTVTGRAITPAEEKASLTDEEKGRLDQLVAGADVR